MEKEDNSIIHRINAYAKNNHNIDIDDQEISKQLRELNFSETLELITALKNDNDEVIGKFIDLNIDEGWTRMPPMDTERYQERNGLEGPFMMKSGKVVYYDPREGKYYDPDTDYYMSDEEYFQHDHHRMQEMQSPGAVSSKVSSATAREDGMVPGEEELEERHVAGSNKVATGRTTPKDPDDQQQDSNSQASSANKQGVEDMRHGQTKKASRY